jgi:hypothetical protein
MDTHALSKKTILYKNNCSEACKIYRFIIKCLATKEKIYRPKIVRSNINKKSTPPGYGQDIYSKWTYISYFSLYNLHDTLEKILSIHEQNGGHITRTILSV